MLRSMLPSTKRNRPLTAGAELLATKLAEILGVPYRGVYSARVTDIIHGNMLRVGRQKS